MGIVSINHDLEYLALFGIVLIFPKILLRFKIPSGITALLIGFLVGYLDPQIHKDQLFRFLSQIGITSLFVFAGLEVNFEELKEDRVYLSKYLSKWVITSFIIAFFIMRYFGISFQNSLILTLGLITPSAGFIINSMHSFKMEQDQEYWIKSKAISKEVISVFILLIVLQIHNPFSLLISLAYFGGLFLIMPIIFRFFFKFVSPYAPNTEVPMLVVLSLISGVISKELGAYYLVGAFIVGIIGSKFKDQIFREDEATIIKSLSSFFTVFLPFYFFFAGAKMSIADMTIDAATIGLIFAVLFIPFRLILNSFSLRFFLKNITSNYYTISLSLMPTLIFGLVIAGILRESGEVPDKLIYALVIYTLITSFTPSILHPIQKSFRKNKEQGPPDQSPAPS